MIVRTTLALLAVCLLAGCPSATTGTAEQQAAGGKQIAKLESRGWKFLDFLGEIVGNVATNTLTNFATEKMGGQAGQQLPARGAGFRK